MQYFSYIRWDCQQTGDAYIYNFSRDTCAEKALLMTQDYLAAVSELEENPELYGERGDITPLFHKY